MYSLVQGLLALYSSFSALRGRAQYSITSSELLQFEDGLSLSALFLYSILTQCAVGVLFITSAGSLAMQSRWSNPITVTALSFAIVMGTSDIIVMQAFTAGFRDQVARQINANPDSILPLRVALDSTVAHLAINAGWLVYLFSRSRKHLGQEESRNRE